MKSWKQEKITPKQDKEELHGVTTQKKNEKKKHTMLYNWLSYHKKTIGKTVKCDGKISSNFKAAVSR